MECPHCGSELEHTDIFGRLCAHQDGAVLGDIYVCPVGRAQEGCDYEGHFYTYRSGGDLHEGYPC